MAKKSTKKVSAKKIEKVVKKASKSKYFGVFIVVVAIMIAAFVLYCYFNPEIYNALFNKGGEPLRSKDNVIKYYETSYTASAEIDDVKIHVVDVGQGDAIIIELPDGSNVLIDAGKSSKHQQLLAYTESLNIDVFDVVLLTHSDEDHVGGMDEIFRDYVVKNVYRPYIFSNNKDYQFEAGFNQGEVQHETDAYAKFLNCLYIETYLDDNQNYYCNWEFFNADSGFSRDIIYNGVTYEYKFDFLTPTKNFDKLEYDEYNDFSPYVLFTYGVKGAEEGDSRFDMLFTGDAEHDALEELLDAYATTNLDVDVLKVGHHGSRTSTTTEFINKITPEHALISCGEDKHYKHPHQSVLDILIENDVGVFRTDKHKDIIVSVSISGEYGITYTQTGTILNLFVGGDAA